MSAGIPIYNRMKVSIITTFRFFLLIAAAGIIFAGCGPKRLDKEKFILVYYDILLMQESRGGEIGAMELIRNEVYKKHGITDEEYRNTLAWYSEDKARWEEFYTGLTEYVKEREREVMGSNSNKPE